MNNNGKKKHWKINGDGFYQSVKVGPFVLDVVESDDGGYLWGVLASNRMAWLKVIDGQADSIAEARERAKGAVRRLIESASADLDALDSSD